MAKISDEKKLLTFLQTNVQKLLKFSQTHRAQSESDGVLVEVWDWIIYFRGITISKGNVCYITDKKNIDYSEENLVYSFEDIENCFQNNPTEIIAEEIFFEKF